MNIAARISANESILCVGLRHLKTEREILVLKVKNGEFFAFPPYAKKPIGSIDSHMSWHKSGERHFTVRFFDGKKWRTHKTWRVKSKVDLGPPANLKGAAPLFQSGILLFQFLELPATGTNSGHSLVLDADVARFRDDFIAIKVYLVEPGRADQIPTCPDTGPRILKIVRSTSPWIAIDVFQQAIPEPD